MKKDCLIKISGKTYDSNEDKIELVTVGRYTKKGGKHIYTYEELHEMGMVTATLEVDNENISLTKCGGSNSFMTFSQGKKHFGYYETPCGHFTVGVTTDYLKVDVHDSDAEIQIDYLVDINNVPHARHSMSLLLNLAPNVEA